MLSKVNLFQLVLQAYSFLSDAFRSVFIGSFEEKAMRLTVRFSGGKRSDFGNHDYEGVLSEALKRFKHRLKQVYLYVEDVNGPRGGIDKQCRCVLHLRRLPPIVIQDEDKSMPALLRRVADRATYALSQKVDRKTKRVKRDRKQRKQLLVAAADGWDD